MLYLLPDKATLMWLESQLDAGPPEAEGVQGGPGIQQWEGHPWFQTEGREEAEASISDTRLPVLYQQLQPYHVHL